MHFPEVIGVDIGGTAIKLGRFSADGKLLQKQQVQTPQPATPGAVCIALVEAIEALDPDRRALLVGIGLPGPMDVSARVSRFVSTCPVGRRCLLLTG